MKNVRYVLTPKGEELVDCLLEMDALTAEMEFTDLPDDEQAAIGKRLAELSARVRELYGEPA